MDNLKVQVNNEAESKEVQEYLGFLGYNRRPYLLTNKKMREDGYQVDYEIGFLFAESNGYVSFAQKTSTTFFTDHRFKELTIQQLRDLVVLKRNDVKDATHKYKGAVVLKQADGIYIFSNHGWAESCNLSDEDLEPIEKEVKMKEYLELQEDGSYKLVLRGECCKADDIEVPEWANFAYNNDLGVCFLKGEIGFNHPLLIWQRSEMEKQAKSWENKPAGRCTQATMPESAWDKQTGGDHYKKLAIQPMEYALKNKLDYAQANVVKYITRHADKNGKEDLLKAIHNIELMIEHYYGNP